MKGRFNQSGVAMLQVILAFAMLAGLSVFILQTNKNSLKTQQTSKVKNEKLDLYKRLEKYLVNEEACEANFSGLSFTSKQTIDSLKLSDTGQNLINVGEKLKGTDITITEIQMIPPADATTLDIYGYSSFDVKITMEQTAAFGSQNFSETYHVKARFCKTENYTTVATTLTKSRAISNLKAQCAAAHAGFVEIAESTVVANGPGVFIGTCLYSCGPDSNLNLFNCGYK